MQRERRARSGTLAILFLLACLNQVQAADEERFEISSIKAIRPTLVDTISALQERDVARAKAAYHRPEICLRLRLTHSIYRIGGCLIDNHQPRTIGHCGIETR